MNKTRRYAHYCARISRTNIRRADTQRIPISDYQRKSVSARVGVENERIGNISLVPTVTSRAASVPTDKQANTLFLTPLTFCLPHSLFTPCRLQAITEKESRKRIESTETRHLYILCALCRLNIRMKCR